MAQLDRGIRNLEFDKFFLDDNGDVRVRTSAEGTFTFSGLKVALLITTFQLTDTTTALPTTALTGRNSITIYNKSTDKTVFVGNSDVVADTPSLPSTTWGIEIPPQSFLNFDISSDIILYGRCKTGETAIIKIMELA